MSSVIVLGPTGGVGSAVALTAQKHGAKVYLAMRDTKKSIPGLSPTDEEQGAFERLQADLTDAQSVSAAIEASGAKRAFIYLAHGSPDHMKATLQAMRSAGVEFVVLLSSYTVWEKLQDVPASELIPYAHAQVEMILDEVFGTENYVALRPGGFATNLLRFKGGVAAGEVKMFDGHLKFDCITPGDIGRVGGTILVQGPRNGQTKVYLYGPQVITQREAIGIIGKVLGKEIKITTIGEEEAKAQYLENGLPKPIVEYFIRVVKEHEEGEMQKRVHYETGVDNVQLYTGFPATSFEQWVRENEDLFKA
ncbi:Uncharacterized protein PECH_005761 [Penicillium ucsense]|uniref:NmrA-like domain-containing protein n=1 Tax=Penicillium ucsense TaxID=2839758 RepID=A0A8J8W1Z2_9EURO|nr:Uncharacterized protein PECM_006222 [Penicillium ucsense]KAF7736173.1 Uncharacterized protein PECH_005761 [Penicillium ucsense]